MVIYALMTNYTFKKLYTRPFVMPTDKWLDVNEHPIPDNLNWFLATDGEKVCHIYQPGYNKLGKVIMTYERTVVTHWMPMPLPPKK